MFSPEQKFNAPAEGVHRRQEPEELPHLLKTMDMLEKMVFPFAIDPKTFIKTEDPNSGPYDKESVERDLERLKKIEEEIRMRDEATEKFPGSKGRHMAARQIAHAFEGVMLQAADNEWLGPGAKIIIPSRYDDLINGVDAIAEFHDEGYFSHLALAMDVTSSERVDTKLLGIKSKISDGELAQLRYFESEATHTIGEKKNLPRVIVGADRQTVYNLTLLFAERKTRSLAAHPMQIQMLSEIHHQLKAYVAYSREHAAENSKTQAKEKQRRMMVKVYEDSAKIIDGILEGHVLQFGEERVRAMLREAEKDNVYQAMLEKLHLYFGYTPEDLLNK